MYTDLFLSDVQNHSCFWFVHLIHHKHFPGLLWALHSDCNLIPFEYINFLIQFSYPFFCTHFLLSMPFFHYCQKKTNILKVQIFTAYHFFLYLYSFIYLDFEAICLITASLPFLVNSSMTVLLSLRGTYLYSMVNRHLFKLLSPLEILSSPHFFKCQLSCLPKLNMSFSLLNFPLK